MIQRDRPSALKLFFAWRGSVIPRILPQIARICPLCLLRRGRHALAPDRCIADRRCAPCSRWSDPLDLSELPQQCGLRTLVGGPPAVGAVGSGIADAIASLRGIAAGCRRPVAAFFSAFWAFATCFAVSSAGVDVSHEVRGFLTFPTGAAGDALVEMGHDLAAAPERRHPGPDRPPHPGGAPDRAHPDRGRLRAYRRNATSLCLHAAPAPDCLPVLPDPSLRPRRDGRLGNPVLHCVHRLHILRTRQSLRGTRGPLWHGGQRSARSTSLSDLRDFCIPSTRRADASGLWRRAVTTCRDPLPHTDLLAASLVCRLLRPRGGIAGAGRGQRPSPAPCEHRVRSHLTPWSA